MFCKVVPYSKKKGNTWKLADRHILIGMCKKQEISFFFRQNSIHISFRVDQPVDGNNQPFLITFLIDWEFHSVGKWVITWNNSTLSIKLFKLFESCFMLKEVSTFHSVYCCYVLYKGKRQLLKIISGSVIWVYFCPKEAKIWNPFLILILKVYFLS